MANTTTEAKPIAERQRCGVYFGGIKKCCGTAFPHDREGFILEGGYEGQMIPCFSCGEGIIFKKGAWETAKYIEKTEVASPFDEEDAVSMYGWGTDYDAGMFD